MRARSTFVPFVAIVAFVTLASPTLCQTKQTLMVPMSDGVELATDIYLPAGTGPFPVLMARTPYDKNGMAESGADANKRGYAAVFQDTRGRFASKGENLPFIGDHWGKYKDGYDTSAWVLKQPWCNGKIATFGGSALGITQLGLAGSGAPGVLAQTIHVGAPNLYLDCMFPGGVFKQAMIEDWVRVTNHSPDALKLYVVHSAYDSFWRDFDLSTRWEKFNTVAVHVGGWYDIFAQGTIDSFVGAQTRGGPNARGKQKLVMGPWTHGIFQEKAGELTFPNAKTPPGGVTDMWRLNDHVLKGEANGFDALPAVTYYVMGDTSMPGAPGNVWRSANRWPPHTNPPKKLYLWPDKTLSAINPGASQPPLSWTADPANPVPTAGGPQLTLPPGPVNQAAVELRPDVLVFTSHAAKEPNEITGRVRARLWVSSDAPDTDVFVKLCDVYPDGRSFNVCEGQLRLRFREGFDREKLLKPGEVVPIDVDMWSTSLILNTGHKLRVQVTSSSARGFDVNPNTGKPFRSSDKRIAKNVLYMDSKHPSHVLLPVAP